MESRKRNLRTQKQQWQETVTKSACKDNEKDLVKLFAEVKLDLDELTLSHQTYMLYLLERPAKWHEFRELMQDKSRALRSDISKIEDIDLALRKFGAASLDAFCQAYHLTLLDLDKLVIDSLQQLALKYYVEYPNLIQWLIENPMNIGDLHVNVTALEFTNHENVLANPAHAQFLDAMIANNHAKGFNIVKVMEDIRHLPPEILEKMLACPSFKDSMLYLAGVLNQGEFKELRALSVSVSETQVKLIALLQEVNLDAGKCESDNPAFTQYLFDRPAKWSEFRALMTTFKNDTTRIGRRESYVYENMDNVLKQVSAAELDSICSFYDLTLYEIDKLQLNSLTDLVLTHSETYPELMRWIIKNNYTDVAVHKKIIFLDYGTDDRIKFVNPQYARFLNDLLKYNHTDGHNLVEVTLDIKRLPPEILEKMLACPSFKDSMLYLATVLKWGDFKELDELIDSVKKSVKSEASLAKIFADAKLNFDEYKTKCRPLIEYLLSFPHLHDEFNDLVLKGKKEKSGFSNRSAAIYVTELNAVMERLGGKRFADFRFRCRLSLIDMHNIERKELLTLAEANAGSCISLVKFIIDNAKSPEDVDANIAKLDKSKIHFANPAQVQLIDDMLSRSRVKQEDEYAVISSLNCQPEQVFAEMMKYQSFNERVLCLEKINGIRQYPALTKLIDRCKADVELLAKINDLHEYGNTLITQGRVVAGNKCLALAEELKNNAEWYLVRDAHMSTAKAEFNKIMTEGLTTMRSDRRLVDILAHIAICASVIGLLIIGVRALYTHQFFFNQTKRETLLDEVKASWNKLTP